MSGRDEPADGAPLDEINEGMRTYAPPDDFTDEYNRTGADFEEDVYRAVAFDSAPVLDNMGFSIGGGLHGGAMDPMASMDGIQPKASALPRKALRAS